MLMGLMRKHAKSWLIKFLIAIIALVFIFYFGYSFTSQKDLKVATVNGDLITKKEFNKAYFSIREMFQKKYKGIWNDQLAKALNLKRTALNNLISQSLITQEAGRIGLSVTEDEVQKTILEHAAFQVNSHFDMGRYRSMLNMTRMEPEDFEADLAKDLLYQKLNNFLSAFINVTDHEVRDYYHFQNEKIKVDFIYVKPEQFQNTVKFDHSSLETYFDEKKTSYRISEKIKVAYLAIDPVNFKDQAHITDSEIKDYYEFNITAFSVPKKVRARHILFKLSKDAPEKETEKVLKTAKEILAKAHEDKDFASLAKKFSEGPTRVTGGDLGYFEKGQMVKVFEDAVFKLKKGEISDLVRTRFGYHIIKIEDIKEAGQETLPEVRDKIKESLANNASQELAHEKGLTLIDQMPYDIDLKKYASENGFKIQNTDYFSLSESVPGISGSAKMGKSLFAMEKNEISNLVELQNIYYIFQFIDKKDSYLPKLEEVDEAVKDDYKTHLASLKAKTVAEKYLVELNKGKGWDDLINENKLMAQSNVSFTRKQDIPGIENIPDLTETVFRLTKANPYPDQIFNNKKGAYIIRLVAKEKIDQSKFDKEQDKYRVMLMQEKRSRAFDIWLENLRKNARIEIITPVVD